MFEKRYYQGKQEKDQEFILIEENRLKEYISEIEYEAFDWVYQ